MDTVNDNIERCRVIRGFKELNSEGCRFFLDADNTRETLISSSRLRWLSYGYDGTNYFTSEQQNAIKRVEDAKEARERNDLASHMLIHILLYSHPRKLRKLNENESKCIKALLQCVDVGIDVRFLIPKEEQKLRIALKGKKLFLSMSESQKNEVHEGILYEASCENSPLLKYFKKQFEQDFERAKPLKLVNGRIVRADNWIKRFFKWLMKEKGYKTILEIIGIIIGVLGILQFFDK